VDEPKQTDIHTSNVFSGVAGLTEILGSRKLRSYAMPRTPKIFFPPQIDLSKIACGKHTCR